MDIPPRLAEALAGRYRIERELGAGGMATVYLAHDEKHERKVAIKVLKPELAAVLGAERFVQEIRTTAALSHPHILPLFDSGTADTFLFYVMPYIQGETIREKLNRETQFTVPEALRIATEVADALDYAHRQGIIHRDIKPENILLHDGRPMVMDFGIALAVSAAAGGRMTETGLSLGTPHYMSPEQATADKAITARSDVYSLASVLYEMLTGEPPHMGTSAQQIIMKIIAEPAQPVTALRKSVPPHVAAALAKALEKLPADRFESARAFADALGNPTYASAAMTAGVSAPTGSRLMRLAAAAGWVVAIAASVSAVALLRREVPEPPLRRYDLALGTIVPRLGSDVAISPDGSMLAVAGSMGDENGIFIRHLDGEPEFRRLPGTERATRPVFSPDNQWILFERIDDRSLQRMAVTGGGAITVLPAGSDAREAHWGEDGTIIWSGPNGLARIPASGGPPIKMRPIDGRLPFMLPDGSGAILTQGSGLLLYDFKSDSATELLTGARFGVYMPSGHLLYAGLDGGLFAVPFDLKRRAVTGTAVPVLRRVGSGPATRGYAVSRTGVLVQLDAASSVSQTANRLLIIDPGHATDTVRLPAARHAYPRFSRDGRSLAMEVFATGSRVGQTDIYTTNLATGTYTQLTFADDNDQPAWSPDGRQLFFDKKVPSWPGEELYVKPADNSLPERRITSLRGGEIGAQQWIDDQTLLFFHDAGAGRGFDISVTGADSGRPVVPWMAGPFSEQHPWLSPDRKLVAYVSDEGGREQVWMSDFPVPQGKWNLSSAEGTMPRWSPDGQYVYFWRRAQPDDSLFRVRVERKPAMVVGQPELVYVVDVDGVGNWDLHPDGRRFVIAAVPRDALPGGKATDARWLIHEGLLGELRRIAKPKAP